MSASAAYPLLTSRALKPLNYLFVLSFLTVIIVRAGRLLLTLYALRLDAEPYVVGMLAATFSALPMTISWWVGKVTDRFGARWPMVWGIAGGGIGILAPFFFETIPALFVAAAFNGLSFAFYNVSLQTQVGLQSPPERRAANFGTLSLFLALASFFGPPLLSRISAVWIASVVTPEPPTAGKNV